MAESRRITIIESFAENSTAASRSTFWRTMRLFFGVDAVVSAGRESAAASSESGMATGSGRPEAVSAMVSGAVAGGATSESI